MELVYLWVEDYKNIQNQGFNFSPKFECKFHDEYDDEGKLKDNCKLEIIEKKEDEYLKDFFGKNINVTAIVGKNGSGKSSLLEFILDRLANRHDMYPKNFIFIYIYENKLHKYSNFEYTINPDLNIETYPNGDNLLNYYSNAIAIHINSEYKSIEARDTQHIFTENNKYDKNSSNLVVVENYINNKKQLELLKETFFTPYVLKISIKRQNLYTNSILYEDRDYYSAEDWKSIIDLIDSVKDKNFIESLEIIKSIFELKYEKHKNKSTFSLFENINTPNKYRLFNDELLESIPEIFKNNKKENIEIKVKEIDIEILEYIRKLPYIYEIDLIDKNKINIDSLSFGEKQLLIQLHYILFYASQKDYVEWIPTHIITDGYGDVVEEIDEYDQINEVKNILIFLDEFEIGLHPQWQKKTIHYIANFLKNLKVEIHVILTTHSPFLLSDIPKQNIIFLDKDENGKCIVVDGLKEKKQTFGANIHTLLSDSFFMEDGLMGEFAKGKIDKAIKLLNQDKLNEEELKYCEQIISIIGEPIVKNQLQRMLTAKKIDYLAKDTKEEIAFLKHRIDLLSKRL
ncbi:MAG: hypothetical protein COB07_12525 [Sulfurovum sp.]|nr:MAG: hypothetical protein COB07_12525 [Sulfurovum sp.]